MSPRQHETLRLIERRQPITRAELAQRMNCEPTTVSQYLMALRREGLIEPTGCNRHSVWVTARRMGDQPIAIIQAASVWEYARRCAQEVRA